jgi:hypothetical protein
VYPELTWLHDQGVNIWYDEGIPAGSNWGAESARALEALIEKMKLDDRSLRDAGLL